MSAPIVAYHLLLPVLPEFLSLYPEIELDLDFNDRVVDLIDEGVDDLIDEGVDVAIRGGQMPDTVS